MLKKSMDRLKNYIPLRKGGNSAINNITDTTSKQLLQNTIYTMSLDEFTAHIEDYTDQTKLEANRDDNKESGRLTKLLPTKDGYGEDYLYRGMAINAEELKNIITKEGLQTEKTENGIIYFIASSIYNQDVIHNHAIRDKDGQISVIFGISPSLLEQNKVSKGGSGDNAKVYADIPAHIIQQSKIFVINYKNKSLTEIQSNSEHKGTSNVTQDIADTLKQEKIETYNQEKQEDPETTNIPKNENPTNKKYNAVHIAKTGRKAVSHGANRIPGGPGSAKMGIEAIVGKTLGGEKLSPTQQKLYGRGSALSLVGWGLGRLGVHTGHLRLGLPLPVLSALSSAVVAAAQASVVGGDSNIGKIFKEKMKDYLETIAKYIQKIKGDTTDQQTQEQIATVETNIQEVEKLIAETTDEEAVDMIKEIIVDLPETKADEKYSK